MRQLLYLFTLLCCLLPLQPLMAQEKDEKLAAEYYNSGEYDKAAVIYQKILGRNEGNVYAYENLLKCFFELKKFDEAEKMVKKQLKRNKNTPSYAVDLGFVYQRSGKADEARKQYQSVIKNLAPEELQVIATANAFIKRSEYAFAAETFLKARDLFAAEYLFSTELAQVYGNMGEKEKMVNEYLNSVMMDESQLEDVQGMLLSVFQDKKKDYELLKKVLLKRMQAESNKRVFPDLLIWLLIQQKEYDAAFVQSKAYDKRFNEQGKKLFDLAETARANDLFEFSEKVYMAVMDLGKEKPFFAAARYGLTDARAKRILSQANYSRNDLLLLEADYVTHIKEVGFNYLSAKSIRDLAHLQAFYLYKYDSALLLLKELCHMPRVNPSLQADAKLELGDIYLFMGEVWEATLMYEQVDYDFKEDPLGQEAKFRNARLSYFRGDFEWAQAQLDVLKTATSQLISNNAIELSLLIQDNLGLDSTEEALQLFAAADLFLFRNKADSATFMLNELEKRFPKHSTLADDIAYTRGRICLLRKNCPEALNYFDTVYTRHAGDILADNALFQAAQLQELYLDNKVKAAELYEKLFTTYPGSLFSVEARKKFRLLRGDSLN